MSHEDPNRNVILLPWVTAAALCSWIVIARNPEQIRTLTQLLGIAVTREGGGGGPPVGPTGGGESIPNFFSDDGGSLAFHIPPVFLLLGALAVAGFAVLSGSRQSHAVA